MLESSNILAISNVLPAEWYASYEITYSCVWVRVHACVGVAKV